MKLDGISKAITSYFKENNAEILMGMGIATSITATGLAIYSTPEALKRIDKHKKKVGKEKLTKWETFKVAMPCYITTAVATGASVFMLVGSGYISGKKTATMATLYSISETGAKIYREKVIEAIGEKKEDQIRDEVAKEKLGRANLNNVIVVGSGSVMCFDDFSKQVFRSDMETIRTAQNDFNQSLLSEMFLPLNEWYDMLNLEHVDYGDDIGWNANGFLDIRFVSKLIDGIPYLVLDMSNRLPDLDYKRY